MRPLTSPDSPEAGVALGEHKRANAWQPAPLAEGVLLGGRFEVLERIGSDGFSLRYKALDRTRNEEVLVLELAPAGTRRTEGGAIGWEAFGDAYAFRLVHLLLEEAKAQSRVRAPGLVRWRDAFAERGTAYIVYEYFPDARTLEQELARTETLPLHSVLRIAEGLAATADFLRQNEATQFELDPDAVLIRKENEPWLLGLGAAKAWHRDFGALGEPQSLAPPELCSSAGRSHGHSDVYIVSAILFRALTGVWPQSEIGAKAKDILPVPAFLSEPAAARLWRAIVQGLSLLPAERPATCGELLRIASSQEQDQEAKETLQAFDERAIRLMAFRFHKRQCPACGGLLEDVRPLGLKMCPVCRDGAVRMRRFEERLCPICKIGVLRKIRNSNPLRLCPACRTGFLVASRPRLFAKKREVRCPTCAARFRLSEDLVQVLSVGSGQTSLRVGETLDAEHLRRLSGRSTVVFACDSCEAQFDELPGGARRLVVPETGPRRSLYLAQEWFRIAAGLPPGAGNAECSECRAEFDLQEDRSTLLCAPSDPYGYARRYLWRPVPIEDARWLGVGKRSHRPGTVCSTCGTEFDWKDSRLTLVHTEDKRFANRIGRCHNLEDWHRIGKDLPLAAEEGRFEADFDAALVEAYERGEVPLRASRKDALIWRSQARGYCFRKGGWRSRGTGKLIVTTAGIQFRSLFRSVGFPFARIESACAEDGARLVLRLSGEHPIAFELPAVELKSNLRSGTRKVSLTADNLARRIQIQIASKAAKVHGVEEARPAGGASGLEPR